MTKLPTQLSLAHMDIKADARLSDFQAPSFRPILSAIQEMLEGKVQELYLFGDVGSGKTHLLTAMHKAYLATQKSAIFISLAEFLHTDPQALSGLEMFRLIIIDDIHLAIRHRDWQEALFHLINRARRQECQLLYSATIPPNELEFELPDLITRLSQAPSFALPNGEHAIDRHALLMAILRQKGWQLPEVIIEHFVAEGPRHAGDMMQVLTAIVPYFSHRGRKLPQKLLDEIKNAITKQSLLVELADLHLDEPDKHEMPELPLTHYL